MHSIVLHTLLGLSSASFIPINVSPRYACMRVLTRGPDRLRQSFWMVNLITAGYQQPEMPRANRITHSLR